MPAKKQITKERILSTALELLRAGGAQAVNVKALAKQLNCSTQPIYLATRTILNLANCGKIPYNVPGKEVYPFMELTREQALALLREYNQEQFHLRHALTVESVMGWYARELGYGEQEEFWSIAGLLHDLDFERWPDEHCVKTKELMEEKGLDPALIHAVCSHGWGLTGTDARPEHEMERVLFAADELTGLIGAAALMRPSKSTKDMELKSLKKKFKDKKFAAGCSRETITQGAQLLGWDLDVLLERTLRAMQDSEDAVEKAVAAL